MLLSLIRMRQQRGIVRAFEQAGALAAERACRIEQLGLPVSMAWQQLASLGVLRSPAAGRWFLDQANWRRLCRRRALLAVAAVVGVLLLWVFAWSMSWM